MRPCGSLPVGAIVLSLALVASPFALSRASAPQAGGPREIELGGPRKARAVVEQDGDDLVVRVRFLAVASFDRATNLDLNRGKGVAYALRALTIHVAGEKSARLTTSRTEVTRFGLEGKSFALTLRVPRDAVRVEGRTAGGESGGAGPATGAPARHGPDSPPARSVLFTRKDDYVDTLDRLGERYRSEANRADLVLEGDEHQARIRALLAEAERDLGRVAADIEGDALLDFLERDHLATEIGRRRDAFIKLLGRPDGPR